MTEISKIAGSVARVVAQAAAPVERKAAATASPARVPAQVQARAPAQTETAEQVQTQAVRTAESPRESAVEPLSPTGPTRTTAYSDASTGRYVIQVREAQSNEVINQYPPKDLLRFYAAAREALEQAIARATKSKDLSA